MKLNNENIGQPKISPFRIGELLKRKKLSATHAPSFLSKTESNVHTDSRKIRSGDVYIAIKGHAFDGHDYIGEASKGGASLIIAESDVGLAIESPIIKVGSTREAWSYISAEAWGNPQDSLVLIGVTGTNGKTSTVWFIRELFSLNSTLCSTLGTLGFYCGDHHEEIEHTTPDPPILFGLLRRAVSNGSKYLAMEVSSHSLNQNKLGPIEFDCAAFTSFSQDHLDHHKTMDAYLEAKLLLFSKYLKTSSISLLHSEVEKTLAESNRTLRNSIIYGAANCDVLVHSELTNNRAYTQVSITGSDTNFSAEIPLIGRVFAENFAAAVILTRKILPNAINRDLTSEESQRISTVPGRMAPYRAQSIGRPLVLVDSAHTPDALSKAIRIAREVTTRTLTVVFGCGGDRDPLKRPVMGALAEELADRVFVTSDNSRSESTASIVEEICSKLLEPLKVFIQYDRKIAIQMAISSSTNGDTVLIAGKGHEDYQILGAVTSKFSDGEEALTALNTRKRWCVIGGGMSGLSAAKILARQGDLVSISDAKTIPRALQTTTLSENITIRDGGHHESHLNDTQGVVVSPGISRENSLFKLSLQQGIPFTTEIDLGLANFRGTLVAVTGTNGKSTTCALLEFVLRYFGIHGTACGNIGVPPTGLKSEHLNSNSLLALELSSYQLENTLPMGPLIAIITSISQDHMARHGSMTEYLRCKWRVCERMPENGLFILRASVYKLALEFGLGLPNCKTLVIHDEEQTVDLSNAAASVDHWWATETGIFNANGQLFGTLGFGKQGLHNLINCAFVYAACLAIAPKYGTYSWTSALAEFPGLPHRCQAIGKTKLGMNIINDSKSTNVESTLAALTSTSEPVILLLGGVGKDESYAPILKFSKNITHVLAFGESRAKIASDLSESIQCRQFATLKEATVFALIESATIKAHILLSPAGASFDEFKNFEDRGNHFQTWARGLPN